MNRSVCDWERKSGQVWMMMIVVDWSDRVEEDVDESSFLLVIYTEILRDNNWNKALCDSLTNYIKLIW